MEAKDAIKGIKALLGMEVKLETMKLDNGVTIEADSFEAEREVFIVQDDERVALPIGEYVLENGQVLVVAEEGIIAEIKEAQEEPAEEPAQEEAPAQDEPELANETEAPATPKKVVESVSKETHFAEVEKLQAEIDALKAQVTELSKVEEVVEEESTELHSHNPNTEVKKTFTFNQTRKQSNMTTQARVFNKLFK
jgi:hypothetical protein